MAFTNREKQRCVHFSGSKERHSVTGPRSHSWSKECAFLAWKRQVMIAMSGILGIRGKVVGHSQLSINHGQGIKIKPTRAIQCEKFDIESHL